MGQRVGVGIDKERERERQREREREREREKRESERESEKERDNYLTDRLTKTWLKLGIARLCILQKKRRKICPVF